MRSAERAPVATPRFRAAAGPLCSMCSIRIVWASLVRCSAVPSVEPSSITINSNSRTDCASTESIASSSIARRLKVGMITETSGVIVPRRAVRRECENGEHAAAEVVEALAGSCRAEDWRHAHRVETFERGGALRAAQLVALGCDRNHFDAALRSHRGEIEFVLLRAAAAIDQNRDGGEIGAAVDVFVHHRRDFRGVLVTHFRVAEARQVAQRERVVH